MIEKLLEIMNPRQKLVMDNSAVKFHKLCKLRPN